MYLTLTFQEGPPVAEMMMILGKEEVERRLVQAVEYLQSIGH